jgi:branched-chain amino acid transport system substrate-binding protein
MRPLTHRTRYLAIGTTAILATTLVAACSSSSGSSSSSKPILIGTSLSLTGDFSADGQAYKRGYELWASEVNAHGGTRKPWRTGRWPFPA